MRIHVETRMQLALGVMEVVFDVLLVVLVFLIYIYIWECHENPYKENPFVSAQDYKTRFPSFVFVCISPAQECRKRL